MARHRGQTRAEHNLRNIPPPFPRSPSSSLPPLARHHFYPILPSHEFASRISANFPRPNPDNRRGSRRVSNRGIFILEYRRYLYNGRGYNRCVFETRNLAYIYIYISLSVSPAYPSSMQMSRNACERRTGRAKIAAQLLQC